MSLLLLCIDLSVLRNHICTFVIQPLLRFKRKDHISTFFMKEHVSASAMYKIPGPNGKHNKHKTENSIDLSEHHNIYICIYTHT